VLEKTAEKFSKYFVINSNTKCWEWTRACTKNGYGITYIGSKQIVAHRFAYLYSVGIIPKNKFVCHHCDNRKCVNPDHLFLGSALENSRDMVKKGRVVFGERHSRAKLTKENVKEIRTLAGKILQKELGKRFGVQQSNISKIVNKIQWTEV
jgi:hypothetical protein